ncbi:hypothetical protein [Castellaniella sp.]|uniref:hypothetical protein n=1 Tax=Castellaniella sp. TaxID=1955812 RepID=UPI003A949D73
MTKATTRKPPAKKPGKAMEVQAGDFGTKAGMDGSQLLAKLATTGGLSMITAQAYLNTGDKLELTDLVRDAAKAGKEVNGGNLAQAEQLLMSQTITLSAIFDNLAQRAARAEYMKNLDTYLKLALRAQAQARANIEALGALKNPAPYIRQANIAQGHQQVNNYGDAHAGAAKTEPKQNKLLGARDEWLDTRATQTAGGTDTALEAMGKGDRTED